jgi:hypothetical protein
MSFLTILSYLVLLGVGGVGGYIVYQRVRKEELSAYKKKIGKAEHIAAEIVEKAEKNLKEAEEKAEPKDRELVDLFYRYTWSKEEKVKIVNLVQWSFHPCLAFIGFRKAYTLIEKDPDTTLMSFRKTILLHSTGEYSDRWTDIRNTSIWRVTFHPYIFKCTESEFLKASMGDLVESSIYAISQAPSMKIKKLCNFLTKVRTVLITVSPDSRRASETLEDQIEILRFYNQQSDIVARKLLVDNVANLVFVFKVG